jgi:RNA polymerase sigma-70 factor (ECF subfamily)
MGHTTHSTPAAPRRPINAEAVGLLRQAQTGDREAFGQLYAQHVGSVRRYVAARMRDRDRDAVPDLVQDTFTAALEELHRAHDDVAGWFIQLAAKMCTRHGWQQRSYLRSALAVGEQRRSEAATVPVPAPPASRQRIAEALARLDPQERRTVQLRFLDGHAQQTTARIMACSRWAVRRRQQRALQHLAVRLAVRPSDARTPAVAGTS